MPGVLNIANKFWVMVSFPLNIFKCVHTDRRIDKIHHEWLTPKTKFFQLLGSIQYLNTIQYQFI
jgi:hypothetical protein